MRGIVTKPSDAKESFSKRTGAIIALTRLAVTVLDSHGLMASAGPVLVRNGKLGVLCEKILIPIEARSKPFGFPGFLPDPLGSFLPPHRGAYKRLIRDEGRLLTSDEAEAALAQCLQPLNPGRQASRTPICCANLWEVGQALSRGGRSEQRTGADNSESPLAEQAPEFVCNWFAHIRRTWSEDIVHRRLAMFEYLHCLVPGSGGRTDLDQFNDPFRTDPVGFQAMARVAPLQLDDPEVIETLKNISHLLHLTPPQLLQVSPFTHPRVASAWSTEPRQDPTADLHASMEQGLKSKGKVADTLAPVDVEAFYLGNSVTCDVKMLDKDCARSAPKTSKFAEVCAYKHKKLRRRYRR